MSENDVLQRDGLVLEGVETASHEPSAASEKSVVTARAPSPHESPVAKAPASPVQAEPAQQQATGKGRRAGFLRRRPIAPPRCDAPRLCLGRRLSHLDCARHFRSTDDAFIAAATRSPPKCRATNRRPRHRRACPCRRRDRRIDDRDYRVALAEAEAQVAAAQASIENIVAQLDVQQAQIAANQAQVDQAQAALVFAGQQAARYEHLEQTGYGTVQNSQQYTSQLHQQQAALASAQATLKLAQRQVEALKAQRNSAVASLAQAQAQRDQAQLNLSYTTVTAAQPGRVVNLTAAVGQFAQPGTSLTMFVPDEIWVTANFKEIQLDHMRPGDPVTLAIDAYPERKIHGHVESVQPGSGTAFSLLPAQNATGNYVKIVQRVPVKIVMDEPPTDVALGPGLSVVPTVRVDTKSSLIEKLGRLL
jgi:membrane fusion protein (multidrug efflux system)